MKINLNLNLQVNRVVKYFVLTDLSLLGGWALLAPVFAVFVIEKVSGATLATIGISVAIYWLIKSLIQLPIANFLDRTDGEKDDFYALIGSLVLVGVSAFAFLAVREIWQLYLVQAVHGVAFGIYVPAWSGIFSRHLDKDRYSFDWSLASTAVGISSGIGAFIGGVVAQWFGFNAIFLLVGLLSLGSIFLVMAVPEIVTPRRTTKGAVIIDHKPPIAG